MLHSREGLQEKGTDTGGFEVSGWTRDGVCPVRAACRPLCCASCALHAGSEVAGKGRGEEEVSISHEETVEGSRSLGTGEAAGARLIACIQHTHVPTPTLSTEVPASSSSSRGSTPPLVRRLIALSRDVLAIQVASACGSRQHLLHTRRHEWSTGQCGLRSSSAWSPRQCERRGIGASIDGRR